jgi:hypothetical protein
LDGLTGNWREWVEEWIVQFRAHLRLIFSLAALVLLAAFVLVYVDWQTTVHPTSLIQDPAFVAQLPGYTGAISTFGILLWCAAAATSIFSGLLLWSMPNARDRSRLLVNLGLITLVLTIDDEFLIHEEIASRIGAVLGVADSSTLIKVLETGIYLVYFGWLLIVALKYLGSIRASTHVLLMLGLAGFGGSLVMDAIPNSAVSFVLTPESSEAVEELLKLGGIVFWSAYLIQTGYVSIRQRLQTGRAETIPASATIPSS